MVKPLGIVVALAVAGTVASALCSGCGEGDTNVDVERRPPVEWTQLEELPANFPADVPIYPGAQFSTASSGRGLVVFWHTADAVGTVQQYYLREMAAKGWTVSLQQGVGAPWMGKRGVSLTARKSDRIVRLSFGERGAGNTGIIVVVRAVDLKRAAEPPPKPVQ